MLDILLVLQSKRNFVQAFLDRIKERYIQKQILNYSPFIESMQENAFNNCVASFKRSLKQLSSQTLFKRVVDVLRTTL